MLTVRVKRLYGKILGKASKKCSVSGTEHVVFERRLACQLEWFTEVFWEFGSLARPIVCNIAQRGFPPSEYEMAKLTLKTARSKIHQTMTDLEREVREWR